MDDPDAVDAAIARTAIIGEAVNNLPESLIQEYPDIPWKRIIEMRNLLIHQYFNIDYSILWTTITIRIPELRIVLEEIIAKLQTSPN